MFQSIRFLAVYTMLPATFSGFILSAIVVDRCKEHFKGYPQEIVSELVAMIIAMLFTIYLVIRSGRTSLAIEVGGWQVVGWWSFANAVTTAVRMGKDEQHGKLVPGNTYEHAEYYKNVVKACEGLSWVVFIVALLYTILVPVFISRERSARRGADLSNQINGISSTVGWDTPSWQIGLSNMSEEQRVMVARERSLEVKGQKVEA